MKLSKGSLYFWIAFILSIQQASWVANIYNDPSALGSHQWNEWLAVLALTILFATGQGLVALRALGSNPNGNGKEDKKVEEPLK